jgi:hypothetical protein
MEARRGELDTMQGKIEQQHPSFALQTQRPSPAPPRQQQQQYDAEDTFQASELSLGGNNALSLVSNNDMMEHGFEQQVLYKWLAEKGLAQCTEKLEAANLTCLADLEGVSSRDLRTHGIAFDDSIVLANAATSISEWRRRQHEQEITTITTRAGTIDCTSDRECELAQLPSAAVDDVQSMQNPIGYPGLLRERSIDEASVMSASAPLIYSYIDTVDDAAPLASPKRGEKVPRIADEKQVQVVQVLQQGDPLVHQQGRVTIKVCTPYSKTVKLLKMQSTQSHAELQALLDRRFGFRVKIT